MFVDRHIRCNKGEWGGIGQEDEEGDEDEEVIPRAADPSCFGVEGLGDPSCCLRSHAKGSHNESVQGDIK